MACRNRTTARGGHPAGLLIADRGVQSSPGDSGFVDVLLHPRAPLSVLNRHSHPARLCARAGARYVTAVLVALAFRERASR